MITLTYLVSLLTNFYTILFCSVVRFRASPAAEKKQKQQLNMPVEKKTQQDEVAMPRQLGYLQLPQMRKSKSNNLT
jgi:hypothetical protein